MAAHELISFRADAGHRLAALDEHELLPLDREHALERFAVSVADFAILTDPH